MMKFNNRVKTTEIKLQPSTKPKTRSNLTQNAVPTTSSQKFASIFSKSPIDESKSSDFNLQFIAILSGLESNFKKFKGDGYDKILVPGQPVN